jgi:hypothetical protein
VLPGEIVENLIAEAIAGPGSTGMLAAEAEDFLAEHGQDFAASSLLLGLSPAPRSGFAQALGAGE